MSRDLQLEFTRDRILRFPKELFVSASYTEAA